jgi:hypothetical protein
MEHPQPIKALLDTNIWLCTVTHNSVLVPTTVKWGNIIGTVDVAAAKIRTLAGKSQEESNSIYDALKSIAMMSKAGSVVLCRSNETTFEEMHLRRPSLKGSGYDVFRGVDCRFVHGPLRRDFTITSDSSKQELKGEWYQFLGSIRDPRFLELKKATGGNHTADLYHLWTAEHSGLDFYITLDQKFVNAANLPKPIKTPVKVCTPAQFLKLWDARS